MTIIIAAVIVAALGGYIWYHVSAIKSGIAGVESHLDAIYNDLKAEIQKKL